MKSWAEAIRGMDIYVLESIEFEDDDGYQRKTEPLQKAYVDDSSDDCVSIVIEGGIADGYDFYFYHKDSKPEELLTTKEYEELIKIKFELVSFGDSEKSNYKICPKCKMMIEEKYKNAFEKEWCPYCGYGIIK